ncbi:YfdX family protein [Desulfurobacterium sp.]
MRRVMSILLAVALVAPSGALAAPMKSGGRAKNTGNSARSNMSESMMSEHGTSSASFWKINTETREKMEAKKTSMNAVKRKVESLRRMRPSFKTALTAMEKVDQAIKLLEEGKAEKAKQVLMEAEKYVETYMKENRGMGFVPLNQQIAVVEFRGDVKTVDKIKRKAEELLKEGRIQDAKALLNTLSDEIDVINVYLPLSMYRKVVKDAIKEIDKGKKEEAIRMLMAIRDSIAIQKIVIPVPMVKAEALIEKAKVVSKKNRKLAVAYLKEAQKELELAKALGYAYDFEKTYSELDKELKQLETAIEGKKETGSLFGSILQKLKLLKKKATKEILSRTE